ncbi:MAG: bifunctional tetrahydrofolate synthase/dihydrofolate synthase [Acinetobacter sp.]|nr:bifunctional tetrahydrofolate synthase/dihydrofolate synthase [Acinetobacter sp.]
MSNQTSQTTLTAQHSLDEWLDYWNHVHVTGIDLGLERVQPVAEYLQLCTPNAKVISVAGTNGKGSTTTTIASILHAAGYKVGLYQSPHIYRFNERVKLAGVEVSDADLVQAFVQVEQARLACQLSLSFFEATTLAALWIFKQQACDVWVLEVGLGGRLDVVNVIDADVAVITNIGLDHVEWLGDSIEKIAYEKAGIIRPHIPVVFASEQALPVAISQKVEQCQAQLYIAGQDYVTQTFADGRWGYACHGLTLALDEPSLAIENVSAAITAVLLSGLKVEQSALRQGVAQATLAGRFEIRQIQQKTVIFDAGHNSHGIDFLVKQLDNYLRKNSQFSEIVSVFSMLADKDIDSVVQQLKPHITQWHIATLDNPRASTMQALTQPLAGENVQVYANIQHAFAQALQQLQPHQLLLVCGSFYTLEAVWEFLNHEQ